MDFVIDAVPTGPIKKWHRCVGPLLSAAIPNRLPFAVADSGTMVRLSPTTTGSAFQQRRRRSDGCQLSILLHIRDLLNSGLSCFVAKDPAHMLGANKLEGAALTQLAPVR